jgi:hypothetical protein
VDGSRLHVQSVSFDDVIQFQGITLLDRMRDSPAGVPESELSHPFRQQLLLWRDIAHSFDDAKSMVFGSEAARLLYPDPNTLNREFSLMLIGACRPAISEDLLRNSTRPVDTYLDDTMHMLRRLGPASWQLGDLDSGQRVAELAANPGSRLVSRWDETLRSRSWPPVSESYRGMSPRSYSQLLNACHLPI